MCQRTCSWSLVAVLVALVTGGCGGNTSEVADSGGQAAAPQNPAADSAPAQSANKPAFSPGPQQVTLPPILITPQPKAQKLQFPDGKDARQWSVNVYSDGSEPYQGEFKEWHPNGKLWKQGSYKNGRREGEWKYWHENGNLAKSGRFLAGQPDGTWTVSRPDGTKSQEENWRSGLRHGMWKTYNDSGTQVIEQQPFKAVNGRSMIDGIWTTWHPNGKKAMEVVFVDGMPHGTRNTWYENGQQQESREFRNGRPHGKAIIWDATGKKLAEQNFQDGERREK